MASENTKPELRHEFIAMVFAFAVGDIGLQLAPLVKLGWMPQLLPAYSHLLLATVVIAASFVGWTQSPSAGGRRDVKKVLELEFVILLIDMFLVLMYFMLIRAYDFTPSPDGRMFTYTPNAAPEAAWLVAIFSVYLFWDVVTKLLITDRKVKSPLKNRLARIAATFLCVAVSVGSYRLISNLEPARVVLADVSLIALVLLFRALKDCASAYYPDPLQPPSNEGMTQVEIERSDAEFAKRNIDLQKELPIARKHATWWTTVFFVTIVGCSLWCYDALPLPSNIENEINGLQKRVSTDTGSGSVHEGHYLIPHSVPKAGDRTP